MKFYRAMVLHSFAQEEHSAAHFLQWSSLNCSHSAAHFSQTAAQSLQMSLENCEFDDMEQAASLQMPAHALNVLMHVTRACTSCSFKQSMKHSLHACAQRLHASIHVWFLSV